ncbi:MAG: biopolymer transporter ExbD [Pirellulaceae bacterium]|nr:biopolymer transporter ExbD [Pirellulaceae bacterium]
MAGGGGGPAVPKRKAAASDDDEIPARETVPVDDEIDFTPMVDIVFLLLIFFMVGTKITRSPKVELPESYNGKNVVEKEFVIVALRKAGEDAADVLRMDGTSFSTDIEQQEAEIAEYIEKELSSERNQVLVKAAGDVRYGEVERVRQAIAGVLEDGQSVHIAVR